MRFGETQIGENYASSLLIRLENHLGLMKIGIVVVDHLVYNHYLPMRKVVSARAATEQVAADSARAEG